MQHIINVQKIQDLLNLEYSQVGNKVVDFKEKVSGVFSKVMGTFHKVMGKLVL